MKSSQHRIGKKQEKILILLMSGVALGLSRSPAQYFRILKSANREWQKLNNPQFSHSIKSLERQGLITCHNKSDGTLAVKLTKTGGMHAHSLDPKLITPPVGKKWDGIWHMVMFDVPTHKNNARNSFRTHLRKMGFVELQQSIFVFPFNVREIIDELTALQDIFEGVVYVEATSISNENKLKKHFNLK